MALSAVHFEATSADAVGEQSAAFDPSRPFLFEGLEPRFATRVVRSVFIPMRDGTRLSTDLHIPLGAKLPLPVVLSRTPYGKRSSTSALIHLLPEQGFVFALQDIRGRHESEGEFVACSAVERQDGYDTVSWLASQPWCNGAVGAIGSSYSGETAAKLSAMRHPNHRASIIMFDGSYAGGLSQNGAYLQSGVTMLRMMYEWFRDQVPKVSYGPPPGIEREAWFQAPYSQHYATQPVRQTAIDVEAHLKTLPVHDLLDRSGAAPSEFGQMMRRSHDAGDPYWSAQGFLTDDDQFDAPTLHISGPQERGGSSPDNFRLFSRRSVSARSRDNQVLIFSPCPHSSLHLCGEHVQWGERHFGDTRYPYYRRFIDWFEHWLCDAHRNVDSWPKVQYFLAGANVWRSDSQWPPPDVQTLRFYLRRATETGPGQLQLAPATADEPASQYTYDPADPTPSEAPDTALDPIGNGYCDRRAFSLRRDVVTYLSAPLERHLELVGAVQVLLHVSSTAPDTDFAAVLVEQDAEGGMVNITHGIARARWREGFGQAVWMRPGEVYLVPVDLWFASIRIPAGHRLGLQVASSHFPAFDRNLNTGGDNYTGTEWVVATNAVHHGPTRASALVLQVRPT
jgi:putative CocE/NonD family hydrolase